MLLPLPLVAADISFDPSITQEQFRTFSALVAQGIHPTPVEPATARGLFSFDIGLAGTAIPIDEDAEYWVRAVDSDFTTNGYVIVPRVVVSKGLGVANIAASYAKIPDTDIAVLGGTLDVPVIRGGLVWPTLAVRGSYADLRGVDEFDLRTYGAEAFLSKAFGPVTPYAAAGIMRTRAIGIIEEQGPIPRTELRDEFDQERYTLGLRFSLVVIRFAVEATQAEERSYAAKVSFGL
ncbi:MAG TPA: hypothetical protein VMT00_02785 [Thermoanaerobaculia bacterium]|nr:hypothetical protein [Thermoanaerobaculia bacterium]